MGFKGFDLSLLVALERIDQSAGVKVAPFLERPTMPAHRTTMRKIKEVLRLKWACDLTHRQRAGRPQRRSGDDHAVSSACHSGRTGLGVGRTSGRRRA